MDRPRSVRELLERFTSEQLVQANGHPERTRSALTALSSSLSEELATLVAVVIRDERPTRGCHAPSIVVNYTRLWARRRTVMKSAWLWMAPALLFGVGPLGGCGGSSEGGAGSGAGTHSGGLGGNGGTGTSGESHGGSGMMNAGTNAAGGSSPDECDKAECGPQLGLPNWTCSDGTVGGPTGRCLKGPNGTCGWEINDCPMPGEGGASGQGGQGNAAGESAAGGPASEDCGGCSSGKICVFQIGGPGPGHFVCAMQNPCGAAAACACIVGQGTCQPNLMGDPPRYCSCDNGLE